MRFCLSCVGAFSCLDKGIAAYCCRDRRNCSQMERRRGDQEDFPVLYLGIALWQRIHRISQLSKVSVPPASTEIL